MAVIQRLQPLAAQGELERGIFENAIEQSLGRTDFANGGFGSGTKFPHAAELSALLRQYRLTGKEQIKKALDVTLTAKKKVNPIFANRALRFWPAVFLSFLKAVQPTDASNMNREGRW